jgi:hypothetical protein
MVPKEPKAPKPKLNKLLLERQGIYFYENVHTSDELPEWLRPIRTHLLHFRGMLPQKVGRASKKKEFEEDLIHYHAANPSRTRESLAGWSLHPSDHDGDSIWMPKRRHREDKPRQWIMEELVLCDQISEKAIDTHDGSEAEWQDFLTTTIFQKFRDDYSDVSPHK